MNLGKVFKNGIIDENPTFVQVIGMCPTLAVTSAAINGLGMGLSTTVVLACSNVAISLLRKVIPDKIRIPLFHSPPGVLFTVPSQYYALSVTKEYLALRGGPRMFSQGSTCLDLLWIPPCQLIFRLRGFHPLWPAFPKPFC